MSALETLQGLRDILNSAIDAISQEWDTHGQPTALANPVNPTETELPSKRVYEASKLAIGAASMLQALLKDPRDHLMEIASQVELSYVISCSLSDLFLASTSRRAHCMLHR